MSWLITGTQKTLNGTLAIGQAVGGGYFAGYISHTADGNPTHALIVAPRATGATGTLGYTLTTNYLWKTADTTTAGASSSFDGLANTAAMVAAGIADHPAANFCVGLSIGGYSDWYLPSRYEMDIAYFNLKPGTALNSITGTAGVNIYAVPQRNTNYTTTYPAQTILTAFNTTAEAFVEGDHWSSTETSATEAYTVAFSNGFQQAFAAKSTGSRRVRAFRRIAL